MKGISTIIATILLVVITIGLVSTAYLFVGGVLTGQISKVISLVDAKAHKVIVRNDGTATISSDDISISVNGQEADIVKPQEIEPKDTVILRFIPPELEIKSAKINVLGASNTLSYTTDIKPSTPTAKSGTAGLWHLDENADDSSGNGNTGTLNNFDWTPISGWSSDCMVGSCLIFDRTDDFVQIADSDELDMNFEITIGAWVKVRGNFGNWRTISDKSDSDDSEYWFGYGNNNRPCLMLNWTNGDSRKYFYGDTVITDSEWHHIFGVYNGTDVRVYLDGQLDKSPPVAETREINHGDGTFQIGHTVVFGANRFNGTIDEIIILNKALTHEEILDMMYG